MSQGKIYIGTSGWSYAHWKNRFYPAELPAEQEFNYYSERLHTVELNNPFYRTPPVQTFEAWHDRSPEKFLFSVKANRYFTHLKKLKADKSSVEEFIQRADRLKEKLGPVLFQLPPHWKINPERLQDFLELLPPNHRYCFEFRNQTWYDEVVYDLLTINNIAFCIYELAGHLSPVMVTADFAYIRLHGPGDKYAGNYSKSTLGKWASLCREWLGSGIDVYVYFDNDQNAYAAYNALTLQEILSKE
jgi:uncharacterized protein YecE (DUF72 family)